MADNIDSSNIVSRLNDVIHVIDRIDTKVDENSEMMDSLSKDVKEINSELEKLRVGFEKFIQETEKASILQKTATELVRVRQELENNFGRYKIVRETMLGVLQATDLALVKKTTISQVTEELMLSTPDYWLAPCLVAVSAWIGNDRDLAERAIAEAVKRDEEKTALTMALICRRNNRTDTCYEWLSIYFSKQSASNFTESNFTYLNAYLNGVFGPDKKHMCDDYVAKWMREIQKEGSDIEKKQIELWKEYCSFFTVDLDGQFPKMHDCVHEYTDIIDYVNRISSVETITDNFHKIKNVEVDQQKLKENIDSTLIKLISCYDKKEEPLRKEERYLHAIRQFNGDIQAAKVAVVEADKAKTEHAIDLLSQMTNIIVKKGNSSPSEKKTSVSFLGTYIRSGFENYITEKKHSFPKKITLDINGWSGVTDGSNKEQLQESFEAEMELLKQQELNNLTVDKPKKMRQLSLILAGVGAVTLLLNVLLGLIILASAGIVSLSSKKSVQTISNKTEEIENDFEKKIIEGKQQISDTIDEWDHARDIVNTFESQKFPNIVA